MRYLRLIAAVFALPLAGCGNGSTPPPPPPAVTVSISPGAMTLAPETMVQLSATVTGSFNKSVTWQVNGLTGGNGTVGTVSSSGLYTAPKAVPNPKTVKVAAVSQVNSSSSASAPVAIGTITEGLQSAPIKLGTSGGNSLDLTKSGNTITCCSGTLGSLVERAGTFYALSNNHVLARSNQAKPGEPIAQPGLVDTNCTAGTPVANLSDFVKLPQTGTSTKPAAGTVDAAIAQVITGAVDTSGSILELGTASSTPNVPNSAPPASTIAAATLGMSVAKAGRSTGLTCSTVGSIKTTVDIDYSTTCGSGGTTFTVEYASQIVINDGSFSAAGDSGSLVVKAGTAEPIGLLYGGDSTSTVAHPIGDVLTAFSGGALTIVGGTTHAVVCPPATASSSAASATVPASEIAHATETASRYATHLMANIQVNGVAVGGSQDEPGRAAVVIYVKSLPNPATFPAQLDGVRTRIMPISASGSASALPAVAVSDAEVARVAAIKQQHAEQLLRENPAIFGVGVGASEDSPGEAAVVLFVDKDMSYTPPTVLDGARIKVRRSDRFRAWGWNERQQPRACSLSKRR